MPHRIAALRHDILTAIGEIEGFVKGRSYQDLCSERSLQLILEREFEIIGEALYRLRNLDPMAFDSIPNGNQIVGLRNILAHGYDRIDYEVLWDAASQELAPLRRIIESLNPAS